MTHDFSNYGQSFEPQTPPPKKSSKAPLILAILGGVGLLGVLVCCGAGVWLVRFGMSVATAEIENQLRDHPEIEEHVGVIQKLEVNWAKSLAEDDVDIWTYDIEGSKAKGELIAETADDDDSAVIISATLRLSTGEKIELTMD